MKNLKIFGDSIIKGVTYNGQSYHLCQEHDFDTLRAQGVTVENNAKMGATIDAGLKQLDRKLGACDSDTTVLFCFGGNDCDYDWKAISEDPDGEHLPHTPSEQFIDRYCTAIRKAQSAGARVAMTSLPPLEQERYFSFITRGLSAENILHWLGDTDHLYRWQEYYNAMVAQLSRAFGCRLVDLPSSLRWRIDRRTGEQKPPLFIMQRMVRRGGIFEEHDVGLRCKIRMKRRTAPGREALSRALWTWGNTDRRLGCTSLKITNCFRKFT